MKKAMEEIKKQYIEMREKYNPANSLQAQVFKPSKSKLMNHINPENY